MAISDASLPRSSSSVGGQIWWIPLPVGVIGSVIVNHVDCVRAEQTREWTCAHCKSGDSHVNVKVPWPCRQ
jgi:hypothetical protein